MKKKFKRILYPLRKLATRFILTDHIVKLVGGGSPLDLAANYVCAENVDGDYLEFGVFRGSSFIHAYRSITSAIDDWASFDRTLSAYTDQDLAREAYNKI